jgi:hypothetical protein
MSEQGEMMERVLATVRHGPTSRWSLFGRALSDRAIVGDRTFLTREKRLEFQHPNLAVFNIAASNHPPKDG